MEVPQIADWLPQFAGPDPPVKINDGRGLTSRARHSPAGRRHLILKLGPMVKCQGAQIGYLLDPLHEAIPVIEHSFGVAPLNLRQPSVNLAKLLAFDTLEAGILRVAPNQIEVMPVGDAFGADELGKR